MKPILLPAPYAIAVLSAPACGPAASSAIQGEFADFLVGFVMLPDAVAERTRP